MTVEEKKREKAKRFRYKKPIARDLNMDTIRSELWDGDEDDAYEFKMAFSDLEAELEQFQADLDEEYVTEYFDIFFPAAGASYAGGFLGFDTYEGDYYGITPYEYAWAEDEAAKKILTLTKKQLLEVAGQCLKIAYAYIGIRHRYDNLEAAFDVLRGENMERIKVTKAIEEQYLKANESSHGFQWKYDAEVRKLEDLIREVPAEYWIQ